MWELTRGNAKSELILLIETGVNSRWKFTAGSVSIWHLVSAPAESLARLTRHANPVCDASRSYLPPVHRFGLLVCDSRE